MLNENPLIDLENIFFNIQQKDLLSNINISLQAGEIVGLIGPNGAGKSTIMKIISGLYKPTSGKIRIKEKPLKGELLPNQAKSMGVLIEEPRFYEYMSVRKNLLIHCRMFNINPERIKFLLQEFNLLESENKTVSKISLGMKQKLGIIRMLLHQPEVLMLDEPTNGLDPEARIHFKHFMKGYASNGKTILISSHLLSDLQEICDRVIFLKEGKMIESLNNYSLKYEFKLRTDLSIKTILNKQVLSEEVINEGGIKLFETIIKAEYESLPNVHKKIVREGIALFTMNEYSDSLENIYANLIE